MNAVEYSAAYYASLIPYPKADANKYTRGGLAVVGGSEAYPGAAILAAQAAARTGAGYVRLITPQAAVQTARAHLLSIPVTAAAGNEQVFSRAALEGVLEAIAKSRAVVLGPGLSKHVAAVDFVEFFLKGNKLPVVLDADGLEIGAFPELVRKRAFDTLVLTPHEGEAARLLDRKVSDREADALELALKFDATVVLKGSHTVVATPQGELVVDITGGPELAKAGSGDVLAGMIGALLAQGLKPLDSATLGVYLHSLSGKLAAEHLSSVSVMPEDIIDHIGRAITTLGK